MVRRAPPSAFGTFPRFAGEGKATTLDTESFPRFTGEGKATTLDTESFPRFAGEGKATTLDIESFPCLRGKVAAAGRGRIRSRCATTSDAHRKRRNPLADEALATDV